MATEEIETQLRFECSREQKQDGDWVVILEVDGAKTEAQAFWIAEWLHQVCMAASAKLEGWRLH